MEVNHDYPILYVFVRHEMASLGSSNGKMMAHSGHASNAFIHEYVIDKYVFADSSLPIPDLILEWMKSTPQGFGTQVNLKASWNDVIDVIKTAKDLGFPSNFVTDPTYPYYTDTEMLSLIDPFYHTQPPVFLENNKVLCFRKEYTAAYVFGTKSKLVDIVGKFPLHP
jgi:hypothetical protein